MNATSDTKTLVLANVSRLLTLGEDIAPTPTMAEQCRMPPLLAVTWQAVAIARGRRNILTTNQHKLSLAGGDYINSGLTLASANEGHELLGIQGTNCPLATAACAMVCVGSKTGQGTLTSSKIARIGRWILAEYYPDLFWAAMDRSMAKLERKCKRKGLKLAFRTNVASDLYKLAGQVRKRYPWIDTVYDYTALPGAMRVKDGVHRVYSQKDHGPLHISDKVFTRAHRKRTVMTMLSAGKGVAVVANIGKGQPKPATWKGYPVIDGDIDDLWPVRAPKSGGFVVMLYVKGTNAQKRQAIESGFAVELEG